MCQPSPHLSMEERHKLLIAALEKDGGLERTEDMAAQAGC